jgi:hypothetical protein
MFEEKHGCQDFEIEINGGNMLSILMKDAIKESFDVDGTTRKITVYLSSKECQAEGAAFMLQSQNDFNIYDDIQPYTITKLKKKTYYSVPNENVFIHKFSRASIDSRRYWKRPSFRKKTKLFHMESKNKILDGFDDIGMVILPNRIEMKDYAKVSSEKMEEYKEHIKTLDRMDDESNQLKNLKNSFQSLYLSIKKFNRDRIVKKYSDEYMEIFNISDELYNSFIELCGLDDLDITRDSAEVIKIGITNILAKAIEDSNEDDIESYKKIEFFSTKYIAYTPVWFSPKDIEKLKIHEQFQPIVEKNKSVEFWERFMYYFIQSNNKTNEDQKDSIDPDDYYKRKDEMFDL